MISRVILLLLLFGSCYGQDTLVKKKYLDSVKNQLAIYTMTSYTYLNLYDKAENEKLRIQAELDKSKNTLDYVMWRRRRENLQIGGMFLGMIILSFITVTQLTK